jgi:hypothetical protein
VNRARWHTKGTPIPDPQWAEHLEPLPAEGLYRVRESFTCCEKRCRTFEEELLVQLGYTGMAEPILFVPEWTATGFHFPTTGSVVDRAQLQRLVPLKVAESAEPSADRSFLH